MAFGIEITNTNGDVQITQDYSNYQLIASGTVSSANANGNSTTLSYTAQASGTVPLVFVRPHGDGVYVGGCYFGNAALGVSAGCYLTCSGAYDYRMYGITGTVAIDASTYGMQVFDTSGTVIYDSRKSVAQVQTIVTGTSVWPNNSAPLAPYDNPAVPITLNFTGWSERPWFMVNNLVNWSFFGGSGIWAVAINPSANTSSVLLSNGTTDGSGAWVANTANGSSGTYTQGFAGGQCMIPLGICY